MKKILFFVFLFLCIDSQAQEMESEVIVCNARLGYSGVTFPISLSADMGIIDWLIDRNDAISIGAQLNLFNWNDGVDSCHWSGVCDIGADPTSGYGCTGHIFANDLKVFGNFVVNAYTITYFVDEEIYAVDSVLYGDTITLLKEPIKQGYKFSGWSEVPVVMPAYDIEIYGSFSIVVFSDFIESDVKINNIKKVLINGVIYILVNDEIYTIYGTKVNFNLEEVKNIKF